MKLNLMIILGAIASVAIAEPLRYRQNQQIQTSARQTVGNGVLQSELGETTTESNTSDKNTERSEPAPLDVPTNQNGPYLPQGWRPLGQLLVLPFAIRENLESTTTVESSTLNDDETTEVVSTTQSIASEQQLQVETSEPKINKLTPYKRPTVKLVGELKVTTKDETKVESKENSTENSDESIEATEQSDEATTTEQSDEATTIVNSKSENLETTSEPQSEAVDVEKTNEEGQQPANAQQPQPQIPSTTQTAFFIQLPDGSFQRIVYLTPQTSVQSAFVQQPQQSNVAFQQPNQSPINYPFGFNPIVNPKIVTFSSQYQAY